MGMPPSVGAPHSQRLHSVGFDRRTRRTPQCRMAETDGMQVPREAYSAQIAEREPATGGGFTSNKPGAILFRRPCCVNLSISRASRRAAPKSHPDWLHEIKHDGYRLIVQREGKRVRLLTRRGYDWSDRYPLINPGRSQAPQNLIRHRRGSRGARA